MIRYVSVIATNIKKDQIVLLRKLKGPATVVGKLTVPGGKIEDAEGAIWAAVRELEEESGLKVQWEDLVKVKEVNEAAYSLVFFWYNGNIDEACAQEDELEKVFIGSVKDVVDNKSGEYIQDVSELVRKIVETV